MMLKRSVIYALCAVLMTALLANSAVAQIIKAFPNHKRVIVSGGGSACTPAVIDFAVRSNMTYNAGTDENCPGAGITGEGQSSLAMAFGDTGYIKAKYLNSSWERFVVGWSFNDNLPGQSASTFFFFGMDGGIYPEGTYKVHDNTNGFQNTGVAAVDGDEYGVRVYTDDGGVTFKQKAFYIRGGVRTDLNPPIPLPNVTGWLYVYAAAAVSDVCLKNFVGCNLTVWFAP